MGILKTAKDIAKILNPLKNVELYREVADLRIKLDEQTEQVKEKNQLIAQLKDALAMKENMVCEGSAYYIVDEQDNKTDGPFCTKCFDVDHDLCRLVNGPRQGDGRPWEWVQCQKCKTPFRSQKIGEYINRTNKPD